MEAPKISEKPNVFKYHDYISFLRDHLSYLKGSPARLSLRSIASLAGLSPSVLAMSLARQRRMTERVFSKLIVVIELTKIERHVLKLLRVLAESEVSIERTEALEDLQKIPDFRIENKGSTTVYQYLSNWLNVAIRELMYVNDFKLDVDWIKKKLRADVTPREIIDCIEFLKLNGYVTQDPSGKLVPRDQHLDCSEGVFKISLGEFHKQMLQMAEFSIETVERDLRLILGHTLALNKDNLSEYKAILSDTIKRIEELNLQQTVKTEVYHLEVAFYPLTQSERDEVENYE